MPTGLASISIERRSSAEQVARAIREMLLRGEVAPGTKLSEIPIAEQLQVSRHTVREAMRLLAAEGLAKHNFQRGVIVTELGEDDVRDLSRARRALEIAGVEASRDATAASLDLVRGAVRGLRIAADKDDFSASVAADLAFHRAIVGLIGSDLTDLFFLNLQTKLRLTRAWAEREHANPRDLWLLHSRVLDAIEEHRYGQATELLRNIVEKAEERLVRAIRSRVAEGASKSEREPKPHRVATQLRPIKRVVAERRKTLRRRTRAVKI